MSDTIKRTKEENLALGREALRRKRAAGEVATLDPLRKSMQNPKSKVFGIRAMCWNCVGAGSDPNPRETIVGCEIYGCALWPVRPWQDGRPRGPLGREYEGDRDPHRRADAHPDSRAAAIKAKCFECMGGSRKLVSTCNSDGGGSRTYCPLHPLRPWRKGSADTV